MALVAALLLAGCGSGARAHPSPAARRPATGVTRRASPAAAARRPLAIGISEANPHLFAPGAAPAGFGAWRDLLDGLRPDYYRLVVDWSKLQPDPATPADLAQPQDGCARGTPPCAPYAGIRDELAAVKAARVAAGGRGWRVVVVIYGVPAWAAAPPSGCERPGTQPRSRPIDAAGLTGYVRLIGDLRALGRQVGVPLTWWSPWNEPNHPATISPQRAACSTASPPVSPAVYATLVRAAKRALTGSGAKLLLGEQAGFRAPGPHATAPGELIRALPDDVACAASAWSQHEYAQPGEETAAPFRRDAVREAEDALAARPCTAKLPIWVTETGVGGPRSGRPRPTAAVALAVQCAAQAARLERWAADPRVTAAFQYTFREDPAYPVGLADASLQVRYPTYALWRAWADARGASPARPAGCGAP